MSGDWHTCEESIHTQHEITHTHTHNRGPYILLSSLCVSGKSRHTVHRLYPQAFFDGGPSASAQT